MSSPVQQTMFSDLVAPSKQNSGDELQADGIQTAIANTPEHMKEYVLDTIVEIATEKEELTADDVREKLGDHEVLRDHPNILGGLMKLVSSFGWIEHTGQYVKSQTPSRHGAIIGIWRSKIVV